MGHPAAPPKLETKAYIALILSDGDNIQEQEHLFPIRWNSPLRGSFPVSWTQSPALADFAPAMLVEYYSTRTPNDGFITGPSGVGYGLPEKMDKADFRAFARLTAAYLGRLMERPSVARAVAEAQPYFEMYPAAGDERARLPRAS